MKPVESKLKQQLKLRGPCLEVSQPRADDNDDNPLTVGSNYLIRSNIEIRSSPRPYASHTSCSCKSIHHKPLSTVSATVREIQDGKPDARRCHGQVSHSIM